MATIKFLCSYDGAILPRITDGRLRYYGGHTRILSVQRSISFSDLLRKLSGMCGRQMSLKFQLPKDDMDALVSVTCDEDLANLLEEYERASFSQKIRVFLMPPKQLKKKVTNGEGNKIVYTPSSSSSSSSSGSSSSKLRVYCISSRPHVCY